MTCDLRVQRIFKSQFSMKVVWQLKCVFFIAQESLSPKKKKKKHKEHDDGNNDNNVSIMES